MFWGENFLAKSDWIFLNYLLLKVLKSDILNKNHKRKGEEILFESVDELKLGPLQPRGANILCDKNNHTLAGNPGSIVNFSEKQVKAK